MRALRSVGVTSPPNTDAPQGEKCITIKQWQDQLAEQMTGHEVITPTMRTRIKQRIYRASKHWLPDRANLIVKQGDWVWRSDRRVYGIDTPPVMRAQSEPLLAPGEDEQSLTDIT